MPELKIIKPEKLGIDLSLFARVVPGIIIGERFMALPSIEHVEYQEITIDVDADGPIDAVCATTTIQLGVAHTSGSIYFFDEDEERELEAALEAAIKKGEEQMTQMQMLAQENAQLKQEIARLIGGQIQGGGKILNPFGKRH